MSGSLAARVAVLREASAAARERAIRLCGQADAMRWEGVAAAAFRVRIAADIAELIRLAVVTDRAADALARHVEAAVGRRMVAR